MSVAGIPPGSVLDMDGALARLGGDKALFLELLAIVLEDAPRSLTQVRKALVQQDLTALRMHAHALKGLVAGCGGVRAASAAQALEDASQRDELDVVPALVDSLESELALFTRALGSHRP